MAEILAAVRLAEFIAEELLETFWQHHKPKPSEKGPLAGLSKVRSEHCA